MKIDLNKAVEVLQACGYECEEIESLRRKLEGAHELIRLIFESTPPYREDGSNVFSDSVIEKWKEILA